MEEYKDVYMHADHPQNSVGTCFFFYKGTENVQYMS